MACNIDSLSSADIVDALNPGTCAGCQGSTAIPMGLGALGDGSIQFKRKFRWTFELQYCCSSETPFTVAREFVKLGNRPQIAFDEVEINYLNGVNWIPGKGKWQTITMTYYDVSGTPTTPLSGGASTTNILGWIATIYDFTDPCCLKMNSVPAAYEGLGRLTLYDGCGTPLEAWILRHVWPTNVNWGDLDMGSNDECTIELTLRYSEVGYQNFCPGGQLNKCPCVPCA